MYHNWINDENIQSNYGEPVYNSLQKVTSKLNDWITKYSNELYYRWAIILKENNDNIGQIDFYKCDMDHNNVEVEYCISRLYQKKGFATEALKGVIDFTFKETSFVRIQAFHRGKNPVSGKVLLKAGMQYEETHKMSYRYKNSGEYDDKVQYGIIRPDYECIDNKNH